MRAEDLIQELKRKLGVDTYRAIARFLGMSEIALANWRKMKQPLTPRRVANAIVAARQRAVREAQGRTIRPIVEFFPLDVVESAQGVKYELFPTGGDANPLHRGLRDQLKLAKGIYIFYDSRGRALYVGQAKGQSLWNEMKNAFNRDRATQRVYRVRHPQRRQEFVPAYEQHRQVRGKQLRLNDLAAFCSVYEVDVGMIDELEALLVRSFANDLLNKKMERFTNGRE
jgi:hypothetical protein